MSSGEAGQAQYLLVDESGRAPETQPGSTIISTRPCLDPLRVCGGTGATTGFLLSSLKTAFLAYARACARVRGGPNSRGGVKAVAGRTATRRRATTVGMAAAKMAGGWVRCLVIEHADTLIWVIYIWR